MSNLHFLQKTTLFLILSLFLFASPSQAAGGGACKADMEKFCSGVPKGKGEKMKCLNSHQSELSATCQAKMQERKEKRMAIRRDCKADKEKFCKNVQPGQGRIKQCMKENQSKLSQACQSHFQPKTS